MFGVKIKLWMETHLGKRRVKYADNSCKGENIAVLSPPDCRRESKTIEESGSVSVSASGSSSILLGSFTQSLSSPDTGYSTDGYSPKNGYPALSTKSSSYALSSLLSTQLFKRSSPPIGPPGENVSVHQSTNSKVDLSQRVSTKFEPKIPVTPLLKSSLVKEKPFNGTSTDSPQILHTNTKGAFLDTKDATSGILRNNFLQVKSRTRIKTNPWLSISYKNKNNAKSENESLKQVENESLITRLRGGQHEILRSSGEISDLKRMSASSDSGQGTLDNQQNSYENSFKVFPNTIEFYSPSEHDSAFMEYSESKIVSSSVSSTATNTPISRIKICNGKGLQRHESISEDGTTLVDLMGQFDETSYQKMVDKETDILSDWANTDEDVEDELLTPRGLPTPEHEPAYPSAPFSIVDITESPDNYSPDIPREINFNLPTNCLEPPTILPQAYDTFLLSGKPKLSPCTVSHVAFFPPPSVYSHESILNKTKMYGSQPSRSTQSKIARGAISLLRKLFRKPTTGRRDRVRETVLPDCDFPSQVCSRLLPCSPAPSKSFLTPTPNSFRRKAEDTRPTSVQKGVKIDVIRLPSTESVTPVFGSKWQERPGQISHSGMDHRSPHFDSRDSPFPVHSTPKTPPTATFGLHRNGLVQGVISIPDISPVPTHNPKSNRIIGEPTRFPKTLLTSPSFNNYSPIHRLVVTSHQVPRGNIRSETTSTRSNRPLPSASPLCVQHAAAYYSSTTTSPSQTSRNPPYQYITSSNQNSPLLNSYTKRDAPPPPPPPHMLKGGQLATSRGIIKPLSINNTNINHYYSTPQKKDFRTNGITGTWTNSHGDRIYERVDGLDNSDDGDGEGGDYECDLSLASSSQPSQSQSQEKSEERECKKVHWPMSWGTSLSETESRLLERDTDQKYRRLISQAEALLKEIAMESNPVVDHQHNSSSRKRSRFPLEDCPQSDPLQRKTYDCWALRRLQQELAGCCASPPVLHRSRVHLSRPEDSIPMITRIPLVRNHSFLRSD